MCTFTHDENIILPKEEYITVYKVFGHGNFQKIPMNFISSHEFKFGENVWDQKIADMTRNKQYGFQVFTNEEAAESYAGQYDLVVSLQITTENIVKATNEFEILGRNEEYSVYEIKSFKLSEEHWVDTRYNNRLNKAELCVYSIMTQLLNYQKQNIQQYIKCSEMVNFL